MKNQSDVSGVLLLDKPKDLTSHDVVMQIRKLFRTKKVGHAGTLDPFATGLLVLCLGEATKIVQYLTGCDKEYLGLMKLGVTTDTQDATGTILTQQDPMVTEAAIREQCSQFLGEISQTPPMFSAKRIGGKRLYTLARAGKTIERPAQTVSIYQFEILNIAMPYVRFRVLCSKGTYIRTLAHDIGQSLECGACLQELTRTRAGHFTLQQACSLEQLRVLSESADLQQGLIALDQALPSFPALTVDEEAATRVTHGAQIVFSDQQQDRQLHAEIIRLYSATGQFLALAACRADTDSCEGQWYIQPIKVFARAETLSL